MKNLVIALCLMAFMGCQGATPKVYNVKEKNCRCVNCTCVDGHRCGPNCICKPAK